MTIWALLSWQVLGVVLGLPGVVLGVAIAVMWKVRGLTVAWGIVSGGVGGVVGGLLSRTVLPDGAIFDGLAVALAGVGAVVALFIARASGALGHRLIRGPRLADPQARTSIRLS